MRAHCTLDPSGTPWARVTLLTPSESYSAIAWSSRSRFWFHRLRCRGVRFHEAVNYFAIPIGCSFLLAKYANTWLSVESLSLARRQLGTPWNGEKATWRHSNRCCPCQTPLERWWERADEHDFKGSKILVFIWALKYLAPFLTFHSTW